MERVAVATGDYPRAARVLSLLEGGYDTAPVTDGLAQCVETHVHTLQERNQNQVYI
jgi:hypothetical protein